MRSLICRVGGDVDKIVYDEDEMEDDPKGHQGQGHFPKGPRPKQNISKKAQQPLRNGVSEFKIFACLIYLLLPKTF